MEIKTLDGSGVSRVYSLLAGPAGIGKTTQLTTFPKKETLMISLEKGLLSLAGSGYAASEIETVDKLIEALGSIPSWVKYLCIDSLSEIYDLINKEAKDKFTPSQNFQKFDFVKSQLFYILRLAKQLPCSCFFICHTKETTNGLLLEENLAFDGKLPEDIKKQFDLIVHMKMMDDHRVFITSPDNSKIAKRRVSPHLNIDIKDIEEPNLYKLTTKLLGK